ADIVVSVRTLAVRADAAQDPGKLRVVGEDRAAIAKTAERLGRKKAGRSRKSEGAETAAVVARAKGLAGVVEHEQALLARDGSDGIMIGALAEQVDRDDADRFQAEPL